MKLESGAGLSQTHQSSATQIGYGLRSAVDGSPVLLPNEKVYRNTVVPEATLLDQNHTDLGAGVLLDPPYQVGDFLKTQASAKSAARARRACRLKQAPELRATKW